MSFWEFFAKYRAQLQPSPPRSHRGRGPPRKILDPPLISTILQSERYIKKLLTHSLTQHHVRFYLSKVFMVDGC